MSTTPTPAYRYAQGVVPMTHIGRLENFAYYPGYSALCFYFSVGMSYGDMILFGQSYGIVNGDFTGQGLIAYRIKKDGTNAVYHSANTLLRGNSVVGASGMNQLQLGSNIFQTALTVNEQSDGSETCLLPLSFQDGGVYVMPNYDIPVPAFPCGFDNVPPVKTFYCPAQNLNAYEFVRSIGEDENAIYAGVYRTSLNGISLIEEGFIGDFPSDVDGFDQTYKNLPPYISASYGLLASGYCGLQNGQTYYCNYGFVGLNQANFGLSSYAYVSGSPLVCGAGSDAHMSSLGSLNYAQSDLSNNPLVLVCDESYGNAYNENPDIIAVGVDFQGIGPGTRLFSREFIVDLIPQFEGSPLPAYASCVFSDGSYLVLNASGGGLDIYHAEFDLTSYGIYFSADAQTRHNGIINGNRPVSPNGSFIA